MIGAKSISKGHFVFLRGIGWILGRFCVYVLEGEERIVE